MEGKRFLNGHFLERKQTHRDYTLYAVSHKTIFLHKETILFLFVSLMILKKGLRFLSKKYMGIMDYFDTRFLVHLIVLSIFVIDLLIESLRSNIGNSKPRYCSFKNKFISSVICQSAH